MKKQLLLLPVLLMALIFAACTEPAEPGDTYETRNATDTTEPTETPTNLVEGQFTIASLQIVDHIALNAARNGFVSGLAEEGFVVGHNLTFTYFTSQNDRSASELMASRIVESAPDLILSISTPSSQDLANATQTIPIVITAVTNPLGAGLIDSFEAPGTNVTGTSDLTPVENQFRLLRRLLPEAQTVGIIFNSGGTNAVYQTDIARATALELGFTYELAAVTTTADIDQMAENLARRVDAIYVPTCNTMATAYAAVINVADAAGIPFIPGEEAAIPLGGLATDGIDYYQLGRQTAVMAARILRGEAVPAEMPIEWQAETSTVINVDAAERLGITIPEDILATATLFNE